MALTKIHESMALTPILHLTHEETNGTAGGASTGNTWTKRTLNTTKKNGISGASVSNSAMTLPAGEYVAHCHSMFHDSNLCTLRLRDTTNNVTLGSGRANCNTSSLSVSFSCTFSLSGTSNIELQYYVSGAKANNGLGAAHSTGDAEIYAGVTIQKIG